MIDPTSSYKTSMTIYVKMYYTIINVHCMYVNLVDLFVFYAHEMTYNFRYEIIQENKGRRSRLPLYRKKNRCRKVVLLDRIILGI
jgi:hypothetical protein